MPNALASLTVRATPGAAIFRPAGRLPIVLACVAVLVLHGLAIGALWQRRATDHLQETAPVPLRIHLVAATAPLTVPSVKRDSAAAPQIKAPTPASRHPSPATPPAGAPSPLPSTLAEAGASRPEASVESANPSAATAQPAPPAAGDEPPMSTITPPGYGARYLHNPAPDYPLAARRSGEEGTVLLRVLVSADGLPEQIAIHRSSGFAILDQAAATAIRQWHFVPARQGAGNVAAWVNIPMTFRLEEN